jgi:hypothetical protein
MTGTHNLQFAKVQAEYLDTRDKKHLDRMYLISAELAARYIAKYARERGLYLDIDDLAHDSAAYIIGLYLRKPEFRINPLSGYLFRCCNSMMWRDKTWNKKTTPLEPLVDMELI